ncbi:SIR2 family protein [Paractinoplanes brasiliensis]|uniref:SIR2-like protein n=1 Tax=Paractinoplanes brasiliensis TaxID=52695 RepID=A0A4R6JPT5_9ACTN|nr:SIR2 family protein [Actinoplanes brasiliensis]TDO38329.1 SIR2-like protein [Actinoplanes brasiliensis]GID26894.1 hypothetical protein Abr02nite_18770 [Actinoplanes brasiliensis]
MTEQAASALISRLQRMDDRGECVTLVVGSGLDDQHIPRVSDFVKLANRFAEGRNDDGDLKRALDQACKDCAGRSPGALYPEYRRVLTGWLSADEFDAIAQQAVLLQYRPQDPRATALGRRGFWQPMTYEVGESLENDDKSWRMPASVRALGALLVARPELFGRRILTTNIDPLMEIAIRRAGGRADTRLAGEDDADPDDGTVLVHHLHGFWRSLPLSAAAHLSHVLDEDATRSISQAVAPLLEGDLVCVLGASDRSGTIRAAIEAMPEPAPVIWFSHGQSTSVPTMLPDCPQLSHVFPVDNSRLLPALADGLGVAVPSEPNVQVRHPKWERLFVSQPDSKPPADARALLRELERRFAWRVEWAAESRPSDGAPKVVYWPIRLRRRTSVIHMVQGFVAGALASRGARIVIALDDLSVPAGDDPRPSFEADLRRWVGHVEPEADVRVQSLAEFVDGIGPPADEALLRPIDPWRVARKFYGRQESLYTALAAIKAVPQLALYELDEIAGKAEQIVQDLQRHYADRMLTPTTIFAYLHKLLYEHRTSSVITLSGWDEGLFWEQWRQLYSMGVSQLYNPRIKSLSHESGMVRWDSLAELRDHLNQVHDLAYWEDEGRYIHWLFQNAVLLPTYLTSQDLPTLGDYVIDSWATFATALAERGDALEMLARRATDLYKGASCG